MHLLVAMAVVAVWLPLSRWLLAMEAMDHPNKPQTIADFIGFYVGSMAFVGLFLAAILFYWKKRRQQSIVPQRILREEE